MKIKILHIIGGPKTNGAYKGAYILHRALLNLNIDSKILNDTPTKNNPKKVNYIDENITFINKSFFKKLMNKVFVYIEKILKSI